MTSPSRPKPGERMNQVTESALEGEMATRFNWFPLGLGFIDITSGTIGFLALVKFKPALTFGSLFAFIGSVAFAYFLTAAIRWLIITTKRQWKQYLESRKLVVFLPVLGMLVFVFVNLAFNAAGYTFAITQNYDYASHFIPPLDSQPPFFWAGLVATLLCSIMYEVVAPVRLRKVKTWEHQG